MTLNRFDDHSPIFVVGSARSGTTLLQLMLNAHSEISLAGELHFFDQILKLKKIVPALATPAEIERLFSLIPRLPAFRYLKDSQQVLERTLARMKQTAGADYEILYLYLMETYAVARGARRFGEKLTTLRYVEELVEIFPDCKMVHIVRDPRACVASRIKTPWTSGDVITNVNSKPVTGGSDIQTAMEEAAKAGRKAVLVQVTRGDVSRFLTLPVAKG